MIDAVVLIFWLSIPIILGIAWLEYKGIVNTQSTIIATSIIILAWLAILLYETNHIEARIDAIYDHCVSNYQVDTNMPKLDLNRANISSLNEADYDREPPEWLYPGQNKLEMAIFDQNMDCKVVYGDYELRYATDFTVTYYCPCVQCCGKWALNRPTDGSGNPIIYGAAGTRLEPNRSIATDNSVIPIGYYVYMVDGSEFCAVDQGVHGNHIDIYESNHTAALSGKYADLHHGTTLFWSADKVPSSIFNDILARINSGEYTFYEEETT